MRKPELLLVLGQLALFGGAATAGRAQLRLPLAQDPEPPAVQPGAAGAELHAMLEAGHAWLRRHQDEDGRYSAAAFLVHDPKGAACDGLGRPDQDVFVTALVILAQYGMSAAHESEADNPSLWRGLRWLQQQMRDDGSIALKGCSTAYRDTGLAMDILWSARRYYQDGGFPDSQAPAMEFLRRARRPDGLWSRGPKDTEPDWLTSTFCADGITGVEDRSIDQEVIAQITALDAVVGKAGPELAGHAGAAFLAAWAMDNKAQRAKLCKVLPERLPSPNLPPAATDYLAWFFATQAMQFEAEPVWEPWWRALVATAKATQRTDGSCAGSWDPRDVRGREGGRVYATATMLLGLEVVWRKEVRDK